jgi:hypothetical protein
MGGDDLAFRAVGAERDQHAIEAACLLRRRCRFHVVTVEGARLAHSVDFGGVVEADVTDELDGHDLSPLISVSGDSDDEEAVSAVARELVDQAVLPVEIGLHRRLGIIGALVRALVAVRG